MKLVTVDSGDDRLARFHRGIYRDTFAAQHEPLAVWQAALRGELRYTLTVALVVDGEAGEDIVAGIAYERYPASGCGLVTYLVVAPRARQRGLGKQLLLGAAATLHAAGAPVVFGEVDDPRRCTHERATVAHARLARFQRWGARVVDVRYVQPALGPGLARDRELALIALPPLGDALPGAIVRQFVDELYAATEGGPPDPEVAIPERALLLAL